MHFPRVLGIECVGEVDDAGGTDLIRGQKVAALMGEMGRAYDGGYAEYTLVPRDRVLPVRTDLPWDVSPQSRRLFSPHGDRCSMPWSCSADRRF